MKTETVVLLAIGCAALVAGAVYYAKQKQQPVAANPLQAPTNGNPNNNSAPADNSTAAQVKGYVAAGKDALSAVEGFFGW